MQTRILAASLLLLSSYSLHAADEASPIIVTATRTAQTADETLAAVTVITREDIERQQATSVIDLLRGTPGLSLSNNGGLGKSTSVFLRGSESDHVLVLIDGVKVGSVSLGTTAFQDIPVDQIERIEIVRGPRSSLYGSEAIGGVIQIFTRKGGGAIRPNFSVGAGSHSTYSGSAGVSGGGTQGWYNAHVSGLSSNGINACRGSTSAGCFTIEPDDDGYRNRAGSVRGGYRFNNGVELDAHALRTRGKVGFDGGFVNESESVQQVIGGRVAFSPLAPWRMSLSAGSGKDESDNFRNGTFGSRFNSTRNTVSVQHDLTVGRAHLVSLGHDYQNDSISSTTQYSVTERSVNSVFSQYQGSYGAHDLQVAARHDNNEQFGSHTTGGIAWGYAVSRDLRLVASSGTAFKAPTFNELYFPGFGSASLRPEESISHELGVRGKVSGGGWSVTAYQTKVEDLIGFDASFTPVNIDKAQIRGIETSANTHIAGWIVAASLTIIDPQNRGGGANDGNVLPRRAKESFRLDLDQSIGKLRFGGTLFTEGRRYDNLANTVELAGYTIVDLRVTYAFAKHWTLGGRVGNLFDASYETAAFFNQDGRNFFVTLRYQPLN